MSSNWQQESANNHHSENNPRRGTGGLLSTYGQLPQSPPARQINQEAPGLGPGGPVAPRRSGLLSQHGEFQHQQKLQIADGGQYAPVNRSASLLGNTFQSIRGWSG